MKRTIFVLLSCIIFASILGSNAFAADSPADYQITGLFDGGSGFLTGIYYMVLDTFGICNYDLNGNKYEEITVWNMEQRCKQNTRSGGIFVFYVILPIVLAFLMFWGIFKRVNLFDDKIQKYMAIALALLLAPLGVYRVLFINLMSILTSTTIFLLYIFLFILMLGWGYRNMYVAGRTHITMGNIHMDSMKRSHETAKNVDQKIVEVQNEMASLHAKMSSLLLPGKNQTEKKSIKTGKDYMKLVMRYEGLKKHLEVLVTYRDKQLDDSHDSLKEIIKS